MIRIGRFLGARANPIGVDLGRNRVRMAQVAVQAGKMQLLAAASIAVPPEVQRDPALMPDFWRHALEDLVRRSGFRGRKAILGTPAAITEFRHVFLSSIAPPLEQRLRAEAAAQWPSLPQPCILRHVVAGQVHRDGTPRHETILIAMPRQPVEQLLAAVGAAGLDAHGMVLDAVAIANCFCLGSTGPNVTRAFVDLGATGARVYIASGATLRFARRLAVGGRCCDKGTAQAPATPGSAPRNRRRQGQRTHSLESVRSEFARELLMCLRHHQASFPRDVVCELVFVGGGANDRGLCSHLADRAGLPIRWENPLANVTPAPGSGVEFDASKYQPDWAVAVGLSIGVSPALQSLKPTTRASAA